MVLSFKEFSAWITIEGENADEYQVDISLESNTTFCWIPSIVGRTFKVHWRDSRRRSATDGLVLIDGQKCGGKVIHTDLNKPDYACKEGMRTSSNTIKPFTFSPVILTDDDSVADESVAQPIGEIELAIFRVEVRQPEPFIHRAAPKEQILHERAKRGIQHHTTFGHALQGESRDAIKVLQLSQFPVARFRFRYRPIEMLRAMEIAPIIIRQSSPPGPSLGPTKHDLLLSLVTKLEDDPTYVLSHYSRSSAKRRIVNFEDDTKREMSSTQSPNLPTSSNSTISPTPREGKREIKEESSLGGGDEEEMEVKEIEFLKARLDRLQAKQFKRQRKRTKIKHEHQGSRPVFTGEIIDLT